jgi:hypothetical protein
VDSSERGFAVRGGGSDVEGRVSTKMCPFDGLPCEIVSSCDEILFVLHGFPPEWYCSRAVLKVVKK